MTRYPNVALVAAVNTEQARTLPGHTSSTIAVGAAKRALAEAGLDASEVDGVMGRNAGDVTYGLGIGPVWDSHSEGGIWALLLAAHLVELGTCTTVLIADGGAGVYKERSSTAPWTRPDNEFVSAFGL